MWGEMRGNSVLLLVSALTVGTYQKGKRRGGDSNPRHGFCPCNCLAGSPVRPLQHLSGSIEAAPVWNLEVRPFYYRRRTFNSEAGMSGTLALGPFTSVRHAFASEG